MALAPIYRPWHSIFHRNCSTLWKQSMNKAWKFICILNQWLIDRVLSIVIAFTGASNETSSREHFKKCKQDDVHNDEMILEGITYPLWVKNVQGSMLIYFLGGCSLYSSSHSSKFKPFSVFTHSGPFVYTTMGNWCHWTLLHRTLDLTIFWNFCNRLSLIELLNLLGMNGYIWK